MVVNPLLHESLSLLEQNNVLVEQLDDMKSEFDAFLKITHA